MPPPNRLTELIQGLRQARDALIRQRKADLSVEFGSTKRLLQRSYSTYRPEELPIDINRVSKDLDYERDLTIDAEVDQIDEQYTVAVRVLQMVARRNPEYYQEAAKKEGKRKTDWVISHQVQSSQKVNSKSVLKNFGAKPAARVVSLLSTAPKSGVSFRQIMEAVCVPNEDIATQHTLTQIRSLIRVMIRERHLEAKGPERRRRYLVVDKQRLLEECNV
ncbi:MAG: hypothetical protein ACYTEQ_05235 [Planctomycetota bacterium]|jgi:uncharacterized protein (DUF1778 family)